ncbi:MAG: hypothetical protein KKF50_03895 [Nanoarchaeota archaeon]|nr:hypothetical protein [Nanoarchaeota archaeon]
MKKEAHSWIKTAARDIIAIGGIPFFILVLVRVYMLNNPTYFSQFVISGVLFVALFFLFKQNLYAGLGLIILTFTSLYYQDLMYVIFGVGAYVLLLVSLFYLKEDLKKIFFGIVFGGIGIGVSFFILG